MPNPESECILKPGETCAFCNHTRPRRKVKTRITCHECGEPFAKGERRRLLRGKWVHVAKEGCGL